MINEEAIYIYLKDNEYRMLRLLKDKKGIVPIVTNNVKEIRYYQSLANLLKEGKQIYIHLGTGYLGNSKTTGPYCEESIFESEYDYNSLDIQEIYSGLESKINHNNKSSKTLIKIGDFYKAS